MRFTRLKLTNWKNFKNAEVHLAARAFFVGPNASGKSNILDALRFLHDLAPEGGLATAVHKRHGVSSLRCLEATRVSDIGIEVDVGDDENSAMWTYEMRFNARKGELPFVVRERVCRAGEQLFSRPDKADRQDADLLTQTHLQQIQQNKDFRPLAEFLRSLRYLHLVPQIVRNRPLSTVDGDPYGSDFLLRIRQTPKRTRDALLKRLNEGLHMAVPQFYGLTYEDDEEGRPHLFAKYHHWRPHPVGQSEAHFSDGTLRLLGLLWAAGEKEPGPLLLEEPELSLHDAIVEQLVPMLTRMQKRSKRQLLVTTHSEALLDAPGLGLHEVHRLVPTVNGTTVETATANKEVAVLVKEGLEVGKAIMPKVRPQNIDQLSLFDVGIG